MYDDISKKIEYIKENSEYKGKQKILKKINKQLEEIDTDNVNPEKIEEINTKLTLYEKFINALKVDVDIDPGRILGLTDGIFGMVMTLLIFGISLPDIEITSYASFINFITDLLPTIGITVISFILISTFWIYHHEFIKIRRLNMPYLWINVFYLISISFIPFTTSIIGNYSQFFLSEVLFGLNIFLVLISFMLMYYYAYTRNFLEEDSTIKDRKYLMNTLIILMILTMIINLLDYNISPNFIYLFLLVPIITTTRDVLKKLKD